MPFLVLSVLFQLALVVHVMKTGRDRYWIWLLLIAPVIGGLAYLIIEVLPNLKHNRTVRRASHKVNQTLDPTRGMREAATALKRQQSVDNFIRMGEQCEQARMYTDAELYYEQALTGQYLNDPHILQRIARVQLADQRPAACRQTLEILIARNPDHRSTGGHELYAEALFALEDWPAAKEEYQALSQYSATAKVRYRLGLCEEKLGDRQAARAAWQTLLEGDNASATDDTPEKVWIEKARLGLNNL